MVMLQINAQKCVAYPIRCEELDFGLSTLPLTRPSTLLSKKKLGLPLSYEECSGGKCLVNWKVCSPKKLGGLGVKDHASAVLPRLRWAWLEWSSNLQPWQGSPIPCDRTDGNNPR